jgi:hypothetical protein
MSYLEAIYWMGKKVRTRRSKENRHLKCLRLDYLRAGARARRGESARDSMYTMQCARKDEIFVGRELRETI